MALTILSVAYPLAPVAANVAGGAEQVLLQLDRALVEAGHRSLVIACTGSEIRGTLIPTPPASGLLDESVKGMAQRRHARAIRDVLRAECVDLVHMHGVDFHTYLPPPGVPVLATLHLPLSWYPDEALRPARPDTWLHCVSDAQHATRPADLCFLAPIENGVAIKPIAARPAADFALYLGRICPEKGVHLAIEAAKRAEMPLIIAGAVFPYEAHLRYFDQEVIPRLDSDRRFIGSVGPAAKDALLSTARCLVVPSLVEETSSLVAREALASGTPVIGFARGALTDLIEHDRTGYIVDSLDTLAECMTSACTLDRNACRESARRFELSRMIDAYFSVYQALAGGHSAKTMAFAP